MRPTDKPYVIAGEVPKKLIRCVHCSTPTDSRYLLKGQKTICHGCIKTYGLIEVSDRDLQILDLLSQGISNKEIHPQVSLSIRQLEREIKRLRDQGFIQGKGLRRVMWIDPETGQKHLVTPRQLKVIELALSPELQYAHNYCQIIANRTNISASGLHSMIYRLKQRGISFPDRFDRFEAWKSNLKSQVLLQGKPPKAIARQGNRNPRTPTITLNRLGIHLRGESLAQKVYRRLLQGKCPSRELYREFHQQGFSRNGIEKAVERLKKLNLIAKSEQTFFVIQKVDPCQIKSHPSQKKTQSMRPSDVPAKRSSTESSTTRPVADRVSLPSKAS